LLDEQQTFGALVTAMRSEYDVPEDICRTELAALIGNLQERTLVQVS